MEDTLGKRIVRYRKQMGMTQDQLAERLGVTAQAVSKWENDQSCPDITTLPKLAAIFETTTDTLLGISPELPVREATVEEPKTAKEGVHIQHGNWEFKYDNSRTNTIFLAALALTVGTLYLISNIFHFGIGLWDIVWPSSLLVFGIRGIGRKFSFFSLGIAAFGAYILASHFLLIQLQLNSGIIISMILLLMGGAILMDALRKPKKPKFQFHYHGNTGDSNLKHNYECSDDQFEFSGAFGDFYQRVELSRLSRGEDNTSFGDFTVDLSDISSVDDDCKIEANISFGNLLLRIPKQFRISNSSNASFATVEFEGNCDPEPAGVIKLEANVSFGQIMVKYI